MKYLVAAALAILLVAPAHAKQPSCKAQATELELTGAERKAFIAACSKERQAARAKSAPQPRAGASRGMTRAEEDSLDRAMARNVLQSIEDQLRRQRN
jgi:psiF repeat-containing protein